MAKMAHVHQNFTMFHITLKCPMAIDKFTGFISTNPKVIAVPRAACFTPPVLSILVRYLHDFEKGYFITIQIK